MGEVVEFARRDDADEHLSGEAVCGACGHEWQAVASVGVVILECPECNRAFGSFKHAVDPPDDRWQCNCGERLFWLTPRGAMCRTCGVISSDWAE